MAGRSSATAGVVEEGTQQGEDRVTETIDLDGDDDARVSETEEVLSGNEATDEKEGEAEEDLDGNQGTDEEDQTSAGPSTNGASTSSAESKNGQGPSSRRDANQAYVLSKKASLQREGSASLASPGTRRGFHGKPLSSLLGSSKQRGLRSPGLRKRERVEPLHAAVQFKDGSVTRAKTVVLSEKDLNASDDDDDDDSGDRSYGGDEDGHQRRKKIRRLPDETPEQYLLRVYAEDDGE